ncbi:FAD/NAD(P)-binding domain-containing protein [Aspergillus pseudodeflectus]|uniref:FAD/NAD(P)-binding domain-containing protein n=1 Tax=Aspergillus pseudodeflectus TaxID=176178 RepID=A0ABR4JDM4_9EURO
MASQRLSSLANQLRSPAGENNPSPHPTSNYRVTESPLGSSRHVRIIGIGAGMSGINMIRTLRLHLKNYDHVVYEKNPEIGGTWYENRYPGCKCDVPSHNYQFSWRPNPRWSSFFPSAPEIEAYLCQVCEEERMRPVLKLRHQVERAEWNESKGTWHLKVRNLDEGTVLDDECHFLLDSCGILNNWKWPAIVGLHDYQGDLVHSANWPENFSFANKTVALIGNGSSGVQILPELQKGELLSDPKSSQVVHFIREPTWIVPSRLQLLAQGGGGGILNEIEMSDNESFPPSQIQRFEEDPAFYRKFVKAVEEVVNGNFPLTLKDTEFALLMQQKAREYMSEALQGDKRLCDATIPDFPLGCRRLTPGVGYLEALKQPNVRVVLDSITKIVGDGLETTTGELIKADAIICATGFDVSFTPRFPIIGPKGNLQEIWSRQIPRAYMSCAIPDFPNYFTFLGPNAPIGHGSVFTITEHVAKYLTRIIRKCQTENIKAIAPSQAAVDNFFEHTQTFMPRTAWSGNCISWFKSGTIDGPVTALHAGSRIHFFHMLEGFRGEDWTYTYLNSRNRFQYLGNGFSTKEQGEGDPTWYLDEPDQL